MAEKPRWQKRFDRVRDPRTQKRRRRSEEEVMLEVHLRNVVNKLGLEVSRHELSLLGELNASMPEYVGKLLEYVLVNGCSIAQAQVEVPIPLGFGQDFDVDRELPESSRTVGMNFRQTSKFVGKLRRDLD